MPADKGQRQVGKTFIVRQFAKEKYRNLVEVNFSRDRSVHEAFESDLDVDTVISRLSIIMDRPIVPEGTLLFFDEIQDCPKARSSLKAFTEDGRYDVIASGSLLGIEDSRSYKRRHVRKDELPPLLPVGYEEHITMYGLDFVLELGNDLTVVEVKSGKSRNAASLRKVADYFKIDRRMMLEDGDIYTDDEGIEHYPLFCAAFMDELVDPMHGTVAEGEGSWIDTDDRSLKELLRSKGPDIDRSKRCLLPMGRHITGWSL